MLNDGLYLGDCLEIMKGIDDNSIDCVICDLPYGTTASNWDKAIPMDLLWKEYNRILTDIGTVVLFASGIFTPRVTASNLKQYKYRWIWLKNTPTNFVHAKNRPMTKSEDILVFSKGAMGHKSQLGNKRMIYNPQGIIPCNKKVKTSRNKFGTVTGIRPSHKSEFVREYTNYPTDILQGFPEISSVKKVHTNEKPIPLLEYLIKTYTYENNLVLDNCMGSGTCGVACKNLNRRFIGIELNEDYFDIAKERISNTW